MESKIIIGTALNEHVRIHFADTKTMCEKARITHDLYPTSAAALGRTLSITAIMGAMLKGEDETITTTINGGGPIGTIMAVAQSNGNIKGFCGDNTLYYRNDETGKLDVGKAVGNDGYLKVIKNLSLKQNYTSQVALKTGEIGDDFAFYFMASEQRPSITSVGVLVNKDYSIKSAGALFIELLPNSEEEDIVFLENLVKTLKPVSSVLLENNDMIAYLNTLFEDFTYLDEKEIKYVCDCSKERFLRNLLTLPAKDLNDLIEDGGFDIKCEFCNTSYHFTSDDLDKLKPYVKNR